MVILTERFILHNSSKENSSDLYDNGTFIASIRLGEDIVVYLLNKLNDENEELKQEFLKLKHRHSLLHDVCLDAECERDGLKKDVESLEKEYTELQDKYNKQIMDYMELNEELKKYKTKYNSLKSSNDRVRYAEHYL